MHLIMRLRWKSWDLTSRKISRIKGILWILEILWVKLLSEDMLQHQHLIQWIKQVLKIPESLQSRVEEESMSSLDTGNLLEDAKFYQDVAIELQSAYDNLQHRYAQQARLIEEASGALHAAETQASERQWELLNVQKDHEANVQLAIGKVVFEYREQLAVAKRSQQTKDHQYKQMVHQLQDQVHTLELSLAGHTTLPSMRHTQKEADFVGGGVQLPSWHCQYKKGCSHV